MANEIQVVAGLQYTNPAQNIAAVLLQIANGLARFNITGKNYVTGTMSVPTTSGGTAIPISNLSTVGWGIFLNLDATNYIQLMSAVSGTVFARLYPGEIALFRLDAGVTAPAAISHTAACEMEYLILEN